MALPTDEQTRSIVTSVWDTLDRVRERAADLVLVHDEDAKSVAPFAAAWAARRKVSALIRGSGSVPGPRAASSCRPRHLSPLRGRKLGEAWVTRAGPPLFRQPRIRECKRDPREQRARPLRSRLVCFCGSCGRSGLRKAGR